MTAPTDSNDRAPLKSRIEKRGKARQKLKVITDPVKYRRHQRRKLIRKVARGLLVILVLVAVIALIWFMLGHVGQAPPMETE